MNQVVCHSIPCHKTLKDGDLRNIDLVMARDLCGHNIGAAMQAEPEVRHFGKRGSGHPMLPRLPVTTKPMLKAG